MNIAVTVCEHKPPIDLRIIFWREKRKVEQMVGRQTLADELHNSLLLRSFAHILDRQLIVAVIYGFVNHPSKLCQLALAYFVWWFHMRARCRLASKHSANR